MMKHRVKVRNIKITTIEQLDEECSGSICENCEAICCKGIKIPLLTEKEFLSNKYPIRVIDIPELKKELSNVENVIGLAIWENNPCFFLKNNRCSIYENRPKACRIYDCRKDNDPKIKEFISRRFFKNE